MKGLILICLLSINCFAVANLDSLMKRSKALESRQLHGFVIHRMPLIPMTSSVEKAAPSTSLSDSVRALEMIVESILNKSECRSDESDFMLKIIECLFGGLVTIGVAFVTSLRRGKGAGGDKT